jgi:hypothetical protein
MSVRCLRQDKQVVRTLLANERAPLDALLACDFDGAPELRRQAATVMVDGIGLIINLVVDSSIPGLPSGRARQLRLRFTPTTVCSVTD